jgi:TolB-like protein/DNA-binding winged helix-turn-helix (wHTH) protein/Flp pilus assembly protein TadD
MEKRVIRFDGWTVDFNSGEISKDGATHRLQDQPLQLLDELVKKPGTVVSREQLIARLWPTGIVEFDTGLNTAMRKLRVALGDEADTPRYIETLPRKGYRFISQLEDSEALPAGYVPSPFGASKFEGPESVADIGRRASDRQAPLKRLALGFGSLLLAAVLGIVAWRMPGKLFQPDAVGPKLPTIVVLPLVDMSAAQNDQALCDGLTDELSNWLAHIPTLRVVARTSAFAFKGKNIDVRLIGETLGATHILEGSLRRSAEQIRVTMQLIDAASGVHIWSKSYDLPIDNIFHVEDTVSRAVAENLHIELSPEVGAQWAERRSPSSSGFELYLLARERQRLRTAEDNLKAAQYFRRAIAADPQFTPAITGLAETLLNGLSLNRAALEDVKAEVEPLIYRASQLSPDAPHVLAVRGWLLTEEFRFEEALPLLQRAVKLNPNDASSHRFLGDLFDRRGQPRDALRHYSEAASLDPMDFISHVFRCIELVDLGDYAEADAACKRARELDHTNMWGPLATSWIDRAQGRTDEAMRWIDAARKLEPADTWLADQKIDLLLTGGRFDEALAVARALPRDGSFMELAREAGIVFAEGGPEKLASWMAENPMRERAGTGVDLAELARLQALAGDASAALATLQHAERILPHSNADLIDASQIRHDFSGAVEHARIHLSGGGDRRRAMELLDGFDRLLDTYEKNGGGHFGLHRLRAESLAIRGEKEKAAAALRAAWGRGWRATWRAERDAYFAGVDIPK